VSRKDCVGHRPRPASPARLSIRLSPRAETACSAGAAEGQCRWCCFPPNADTSPHRPFFTFFLLNVALSHKYPPPPKLPPTPTTRPFVPQELHAPYWTVEPGWHTDFEVRNNLDFKDLTIMPVLRTYSGVEIELGGCFNPFSLATERMQPAALGTLHKLLLDARTACDIVGRNSAKRYPTPAAA
jgi:hypothetical protein